MDGNQLPLFSPPTEEETSLIISDKAAKVINRELGERGMKALRVTCRVSPVGGMEFQMGMDKEVKPEDVELEENGVPVYMDKSSARLAQGLFVDFEESGESGRFVITKLGGGGGCGCGGGGHGGGHSQGGEGGGGCGCGGNGGGHGGGHSGSGGQGCGCGNH